MATTKRERQKAARRQKVELMQRAARRRRNIRRGTIVAIIAAVVVGSGALLLSGRSPTATTTTTTPAVTTTTSASMTTVPPVKGSITQAQANAVAVKAGCPASPATRVNTLKWSSAPAMTINTSKTYYAHFVTTAGTFVVKLDASTAPITVNNFVFLAEHNFYNCVIFQRVIPGFAIQGGDPLGNGTGGPGYTISDEYPKAGHPNYPLYSVAMANTGSPHSGGSQFFIVTGPSGETLSNTYSLFGQVVSGFNVIKIINAAGNAAPAANGVPPFVTHRMLRVTISES